METRCEWIEREARAARERYLGPNNTNWDELFEVSRDDWRNVVAPFYDLYVRAGEARPVKVRFDVTAEDAWNTYLKSGESHEKPLVDWLLPFLAAHAVVEAPPGVPSEKDLTEIGRSAYFASADLISNDDDDHECARATAIRDAVLAAVQQPEPARVRAPVDIDGLARAIKDEENCLVRWSNLDYDLKEYWRKAARAALAYLSIEPCAPPEYNPDDVALTPNERNELENLRVEVKNQSKTIKAMCEENAKLRREVEVERDRANDLRTRLAATAAKSARRRKALRQLNGAFAVMHATVSVAIDRREQAMNDEGDGKPFGGWHFENGYKIVPNHEPSENTEESRAEVVSDTYKFGEPPAPREWTDADVEELAQMLCESNMDEWRHRSKEHIRQARAALAWFDGKRGE